MARWDRLLLLSLSLPAAGQDSAADWSFHFQSTSIGDVHGGFSSPYSGPNSLPPHLERRVSLTATAFIAAGLGRHVQIAINPEVAGGKGFGDVTGIAGFPNGEIPRVAAARPTPYLARAFVKFTWGLDSESEAVAAAFNQPAGERPVRRFTSITGKFALSDYFDNNAYSHDPRTQFMNWALMANGAWDYPADVRGYTVATMQELALRRWSARAAVALEPTAANGPTLDTRVAKNRGVVAEWEERHQPFAHAGAVRVLGYWNREHAGAFREAIVPGDGADLAPTRRHGAKKYGFGVNVEQEIAAEIGLFGRYGWSDGKTESWAFTQIDRTVSGGAVVQGRWWRRAKDRAGIAGVRNYLSGDQRSFLAAGGAGFLIGDGRLNYAPETIAEAYYAWAVTSQWTLTIDYQRIANPAYNRDRGPVGVWSLRVHWER